MKKKAKGKQKTKSVEPEFSPIAEKIAPRKKVSYGPARPPVAEIAAQFAAVEQRANRRSGSSLFLFLAIVVCAGAGVMFYRGYHEYMTYQAEFTAKQQEEILALQNKLREYEIEDALPSKLPAESETVKTLEAELSQARAQIKEQEDKIETQNRAHIREKLLLTVMQAHQKFTQGEIFDVEMARARHLIERSGAYNKEAENALVAISALAKIDTSHVTESELRDEFSQMADNVMDTWRSSKINTTVKDKFLHTISGIIRVRRVGMVDGETPEAVLARAETMMKNGNLVTAIAELDKLKPPVRTQAEMWLTKAESWRKTARALQIIENYATALPVSAEAAAEEKAALEKKEAEDLALPSAEELPSTPSPELPEM